ncbi:MAG TPA: hypothetical protein VNA20_16210 [Frankiaceae bacterium]|nr:hypothetical protein [Frankiaceae bacterium]
MSGLRFDVTPLLRGHWKGLTDGRFPKYHPDWLARGILCIPAVLAIAAVALDWKLASPTPLLSAVALLAGALVGSFGSLSTLRLKLADWGDRDDTAFQVQKDMIDETVAHLLTAALFCAVTALMLVIGTNTANHKGEVTGSLGAIIIGLASYVFLVFVLILPRLYAAYVEINNVRDRLSGFSRGRFDRDDISSHS